MTSGRVFFGWRLAVTVSLVVVLAGSVGRVASTSVGSDDEESLVDRDNDPLNLDISGFADSGSPSLEEEMMLTRDPADIYVGGFFPTSRNLTEGSIGRGVIPAVNLALKHINQSPDILRGYRLNIHWNNTECDAAKGMKSFFDMMAQKNKKIMMLFGAACTSVTDPIAKTSRFFELVQLTYADTHPMYTSDNYPYFFRVVPSESSFNPARLALLQHFNWTRVGTLYQSSPRYALPHTKLLTDLDAAQISIGISESIGDELQDELQKLKTSNVRIILGSFDEDWARKIFCEAYHQGMYGRKYQWIIVSMYRERWWEYNLDATRCQLDEILEALEGYIGTDVLPLSTSENVTVSSLTPMEYEELYNQTREGEYSRFHGYAYDGIWALAIAVQRILVKLKNLGNAWQLEEFQYRDVFWGRLFREALNETDFVGVTGLVNFVKNERRGLVLLKQLQAGEEVKIGEFDCTLSDLDLSKGSPILWRGSGRPMDRTLSIQRKNRINLTIYTILVISAVCGIILAFVFLVVNIKYRNQRYIKMSSPYLNNMIIMGCILTYTSIILLGLDSGLTSENNFPYICAARAWVLMSGFTLAFGSMFSKTWRVHAIFTNIELNKKVIKDYKLFMVVGVLVLIDVIILTTWQIVDPFYRETTNGTAIPSPENEDLEIIPEMEFCQSKKMTVFLGSIYAYKGLLMAFGCFLAWETRHVSIPALNDSKYVGMSVYNVVIMCSIGAAISFVLREQQDAAFIIISVFIIFCSTTTLCLVFVPKLVELRRNPQAGDKRVRATLKPLKQSRKNSDDLSLYGRIKLLQEENLRHRQTLEEKNLEVQALLMKLRETREPVIVISHEVTTIPEVTSPTPENSTTDREENSMDGKEDRSPVVEEQIQSRKYSAISLDIKPSLSAKKRVRIRTENSCPDLVSPTREERLSGARVDAVPRKGGSTGILNAANGAVNGTTAPKRCLSFLDQVSLVAKFVDTSESGSSGAESDSDDSQKSFLRDKTENGSGESNGTRGGRGDHRAADNGYAYQAPQQLESDDTSYARAIKNSHSRREFVNGLSSSAEEDTDRYDPGTHSEESDSSRPGHRRAKSLGTLRSPMTAASSANGTALGAGETDRAVQAGGVSVIEGRRAEPALLPPLFPFFNRLVSEGTSVHRTGHQREVAAGGGVYSSFPSIKCDIVEYL